MPSSYPTGYDSLPTSWQGTDYQSTVDHAGTHNRLSEAVMAIQQELGLSPSDSWATVKARLDAMASAAPTAHKASHAAGGTDALTPADIGAVPASVLTTKGDLLTHNGSALVREPVGADGQVLVADASQPEGLGWATVLPRRNASAGQWIIPGETFGTQAGGNGYFFGSPVLVGAPMSVDALSVTVTGAPGSARGATMAVYRLTPTGWSLVAGTSVSGVVTAGFTGVFTLTLPSAVRLASGIYCAVVGGSLASITLAAVTQNSLMAGLVSRATVDMATARGGGLFTTGGGQPATLALAEWPAAPAVGMRVA